MRKIIVNSTPIIILCKTGNLEILKMLFHEITIPQAVYNEVSAKDDGVKAALDSALNWIHVEEIPSQSEKKMYQAKLHDGEVEVMILARKEESSMVIIDDRAAKRAAEFLGLKVTGTLGVLVAAKEKGIIKAIKPILDDIKSNGFYIGEELCEYLLRKVGEL